MRLRLRKSIVVVVVAMTGAMALAAPAFASVKIKFREPGHDQLYVHGRLTASTANPSPGRDIAQYGATWTLRKHSSPTDFVGTTLFSTTMAPGACVDKGNSCKYRDNSAQAARLGLSYVKVQYKSGKYKSGKTWMRVWGDLSGADQADLEFQITINSPTHPTWSHRASFRAMPWGWYLSDKCWDGCP